MLPFCNTFEWRKYWFCHSRRSSLIWVRNVCLILLKIRFILCWKHCRSRSDHLMKPSDQALHYFPLWLEIYAYNWNSATTGWKLGRSVLHKNIQNDISSMVKSQYLGHYGFYTGDHFIINLIWNNHKCKILFIIWPFKCPFITFKVCLFQWKFALL